MGHRIDVFGINGMPRTMLRLRVTLNIMAPVRYIIDILFVVRLGPAVFVIAPVLVTGFKGSRLFVSGKNGH